MAAKPVDPDHTVMVAVDPQWNNATRRLPEGTPDSPGLLNHAVLSCKLSIAKQKSEETRRRPDVTWSPRAIVTMKKTVISRLALTCPLKRRKPGRQRH